MTIQQLLGDSELLKSYREWLQLPMTKILHEMAIKFSRPVGLPNPSGEHALYAQGHAVASSNFMRILFELEDLAEEQKLMAKMKIEPEYGLQMILEADGYARKRSKKIEEERT